MCAVADMSIREGQGQITYSSSIIMSRMTDLINEFTWFPEFVVSSALWFWSKQQEIMTNFPLDIALGCFIGDKTITYLFSVPCLKESHEI